MQNDLPRILVTARTIELQFEIQEGIDCRFAA
jgi:hypothetical protein